MQSQPMPDKRPPPTAKDIRKTRIKLIVIFGIFASPVIFSTLIFYFWKPDKTVNYGELVQPPVALETSAAVRVVAQQMPEAKGRWILLQREVTACSDACKQRVQLAKNINVALNKYSGRLARSIALSNVEDEGHLKTMAVSAALSVITTTSADPINVLMPQGGFLLIDPNGFAILKYSHDLDGKRLIKDIERLMKYSIPKRELRK